MGSRGPKPTQQTLDILKLIKAGYTYRSIAETYGLSQQRVCDIAITYGHRRKPKQITLQPKVTLDSTVFAVKNPQPEGKEDTP